mmetsp:Transcript_2109/g.6561  ORF Transcript_2109/g.6561 Transcript_2109/m.6561 type:complete len:250 (-) Transcript_2109:1468-2217(-)
MRGDRLFAQRCPSHIHHICAHVVVIALIHKILLALCRVLYLLRVPRDERVEERVEAGRVKRHVAAVRLGPQNAAQALRLLAARAKVRRDLDDDRGLRQVDRHVANFAEDERADHRALAELVVLDHAVLVWRFTRDVRSVQQVGEELDRHNVVAKHEHLVASRLVLANEVVRCNALVWIHGVQQLLDVRAALVQILGEELSGHRAADLGARDVREIARFREVQPVGLVKFGPNKEVEVVDELVLAHERGG